MAAIARRPSCRSSARHGQQILENVAALDVSSNEQVRETRRRGHAAARGFLESQNVRELIYGETFPKIAA